MAIRRVTGAVSPSELIFADANALGATYDGSGTTIERGETFTLPAGGTTAVSNGALRLEALKGDCTITNNGNSTLTNASGVDGTVLMRSGASDFPAFVRNSSMGSMSIPAREDFTGSLLGAGTFDGTINNDATFPTRVTDKTYLYMASKPSSNYTSYDQYRVTPNVVTANVQISGCMPAGATSIVSAHYVYLIDQTGTGNAVSLAWMIAGDGENWNTHNLASTEFAAGLNYVHPKFKYLSFLGVGSSGSRFEDLISENDMFGLRFTHGGGENIYAIGAKITWRF